MRKMTTVPFRLTFFGLLLTMSLTGCPQSLETGPRGLDDGSKRHVSTSAESQILAAIERLESTKDPKCHATASRLEDYMFGTPLTEAAHREKNQLQARWAYDIWRVAHGLAEKTNGQTIGPELLTQALGRWMTLRTNGFGDTVMQGVGGEERQVRAIDRTQYGSIAYSLRAVLAAGHWMDRGFVQSLRPLSSESLSVLTGAIDVMTLAILLEADQKARKEGQRDIEEDDIRAATLAVMGVMPHEPTLQGAGQGEPMGLLRRIIASKMAAYAAYNEVSQTIFLRNLQVYFVRNTWPSDPAEGKALKQTMMETLIGYAEDILRGAMQLAAKRGSSLVTETDVDQFAQSFLPYTVDTFEDVTFFPGLSSDKHVRLESYDLDAFRDSGLHWRYLQFALDANWLKQAPADRMGVDPYAAELLAENIAQAGVLMLRLTGDEGHRLDESEIKVAHFKSAMGMIQQRTKAVAQKAVQKTQESRSLQEQIDTKPALGDMTESSSALRFEDVTAELGIAFEHRSSDWLSRQLRSYLQKDPNTANITIPPAFGGAGVAAVDVNKDGYDDVLILSGAGNRLLLNRAGKGFDDVTEKAGLSWVRAQDNRPGEPRQPLIADLDNDGDQDIVITYVNDAHRVYANRGDGTFEDVTKTANLGGEGLVGGPATVFDYDQDGRLDLYITYFGNYLKGELPTLERYNRNGLPNQLFRNLGQFRFENVTEKAGVGDVGWGQAVTHTYLNADGHPDLLVGNDFGVNAYFLNQGDGTFTEVSKALGVDKPSYTMGFGIADLNDDLRPDIYVSNIVVMNKDEKYVSPSKDTPMKFNPEKLQNARVLEANDLFLSTAKADGSVHYAQSKQVGRGYSSTGWSWDADFFDADNDGDEDLYVLNGMNEFRLYSKENPYYTNPDSEDIGHGIFPSAFREENVFFESRGGRLVNATAEVGLALVGNSRSAAYLDYDHDGDLDIMINNYHGPAVFYENKNKGTGHWLQITLDAGAKAPFNRDAIGARLMVTTPDGKRQLREVHGSIGYMSVHPRTQHLGLGVHQSARVTVVWPNGQEQAFGSVNAGQRVTLRYQP